MDIIPAIDLKDGRCVRLTQGAFDAPAVYDLDPHAQARAFAGLGVKWLHVVDLDGARDGAPRQHAPIAAIAAAAGVKVQVGGGIRSEGAARQLLDAGIARIVVGSLAAIDPARIIGWIGDFGPDQVVPAFDIRFDSAGEPEVLTHGWQSGSSLSLWRVLDLYANSALGTVLCTDVGRDGMLQGPNLDLYAAMRRRYPGLDILASGGVAAAGDFAQLAALGVAGVVVGKAIYEGRIDLTAVLRESAHAG